MSRKIRVNPNDERLEFRFASWLKMLIDLIAPKTLLLIAGRATAKTSDILAERFIDICFDVPGAYFALVADTYVNALKNVLPALIEGLNRKGWVEGIHYVVDQPPPAHFKKPYKAPKSYKHTISVFNGCFVNLISMDMPSSGAGNSYQHLFGDEAKYLDFEKLKKLMPALRGNPKFSSSVYYRGMTFTTDMPDVTEGEYSWILDKHKDMDAEQIKLCLQAGLILNELRIEKINEERASNWAKVAQIEKNIERWEKRWIKARKDSTFFKIVSSYVNVDINTPGFYKDSLAALGPEEFKKAIGSFSPKAKKGERFYINLHDDLFFQDGINTQYYERFKVGEEFEESCLALKYLSPSRPIEAGVDFGNMMSMVTGQELGKMLFLMKEFYTLPPESLRQLANQFLRFYKHHQNKILILYYDRSGNAYEKIGEDMASELKDYLENPTDPELKGWRVQLMSRGQRTILQSEEHQYMRAIMEENNSKLPVLRICRFGCKNLKSAMEKAKSKEVFDKKGIKSIRKNKASEKLPAHRLPKESTNLTDALKYFCGREQWINESKKKKPITTSGIDII